MQVNRETLLPFSREPSQKKRVETTLTRAGFTVIVALATLGLERAPEKKAQQTVILEKKNQTSVRVGESWSSAEVILSKKGEVTILNVHLADAEGGMLNAEFTGTLPASGETQVYELNGDSFVWLVLPDKSIKTTHGILIVSNANGRLNCTATDPDQTVTFTILF